MLFTPCDGWGLGSVTGCQCRFQELVDSGDGEELLAAVRAGTTDSAWQVREWFAWQGRTLRRAARDDIRGRWSGMLTPLLGDPVLHVRTAMAGQVRAAATLAGMVPGMSATDLMEQLERLRTLPGAAELDSWMESNPDPLGSMERAGGAPDDIADRPLPERKWAATNYDNASPVLVADPVCEVRSAAVRRLLSGPADREMVLSFRADACPQVRAAVLKLAGPVPGFRVAALSAAERVALAASTTDGDLLHHLAQSDDPAERGAVAGNRATPGVVLTGLYRDPVWKVWVAAKQNPNWPADVRLDDPLVDHQLSQQLDPFKLAAAVLHSRAAVRCAEGRSLVYVGAGYMHPPPDAPWLCDRDAVVLHSWGPFCWEHQMEVDTCRQSGGSDGYLAQRLRSALWVHVGQGGPIGPREELWRGSW